MKFKLQEAEKSKTVEVCQFQCALCEDIEPLCDICDDPLIYVEDTTYCDGFYHLCEDCYNDIQKKRVKRE